MRVFGQFYACCTCSLGLVRELHTGNARSVGKSWGAKDSLAGPRGRRTAMTTKLGETSFRADIQGLRAIAVLSVVLYHMDAALLPGGFVGVDIFFVISGFLITGILLRELEAGRMSIAGFYQRRITRLFPALFVMLAAVLAAGIFLLAPQDYKELARTVLSTMFFVSNIDFYTLSGYFDGAAADKPLLHTWSLAVEEQFYIFFPLVLAFVWTRFRNLLIWLLAAVCVFGLAFSAWGAFLHPTGAFYLTPFRVFELAMGAFVAVRAQRTNLSQFWREALGALGLTLIAAAFVLYGPGTAFPGLAAFVPCLGAALILAAGVNGDSLTGRVLSLPFMTFFGAISYSLYLWHWPVLALARHYFHGEPELTVKIALMGFAVLAATASYYFVERPALRAKASRGRTFALGAGAMAVASLTAALIFLSGGAPQRFSPQALALFNGAEDYNHRRDQCHSNEGIPVTYAQNCIWGANTPPVAAVWSDSAGAELVVAMGEVLAPRGQSVMEITSSACPPAMGYQVSDRTTCIAHNDETLPALVQDDRIQTVIIALNFARYPTPERARVYAGVSQAVRTLRAAGKTIVLTYPTPNPWFESPRVLGLRYARGEDLDSIGVPLETYRADNADALAFVDALARETHAYVFRPTDALCDAEFCHSYLPEEGVLYFNGNHISVTGARLAMRRFPFESLPPPTAAPSAG